MLSRNIREGHYSGRVRKDFRSYIKSRHVRSLNYFYAVETFCAMVCVETKEARNA